jgi:hypothetical protein
VGEEHKEKYNLDLTDWRDEIPWNCLRDEIQWVARDFSGEWSGFANKPTRFDETAKWIGWRATLKGVKMPEGPADWREAIAKRPKDY